MAIPTLSACAFSSVGYHTLAISVLGQNQSSVFSQFTIVRDLVYGL